MYCAFGSTNGHILCGDSNYVRMAKTAIKIGHSEIFIYKYFNLV